MAGLLVLYVLVYSYFRTFAASIVRPAYNSWTYTVMTMSEDEKLARQLQMEEYNTPIAHGKAYTQPWMKPLSPAPPSQITCLPALRLRIALQTGNLKRLNAMEAADPETAEEIRKCQAEMERLQTRYDELAGTNKESMDKYESLRDDRVAKMTNHDVDADMLSDVDFTTDRIIPPPSPAPTLPKKNTNRDRIILPGPLINENVHLINVMLDEINSLDYDHPGFRPHVDHLILEKLYSQWFGERRYIVGIARKDGQFLAELQIRWMYEIDDQGRYRGPAQEEARLRQQEEDGEAEQEEAERKAYNVSKDNKARCGYTVQATARQPCLGCGVRKRKRSDGNSIYNPVIAVHGSAGNIDLSDVFRKISEEWKRNWKTYGDEDIRG
jgi:hypothetical protein